MSIGIDLLMKLLEEKNIVAFSRLNREWFIDYELELYDYIKRHQNRYRKLPEISTVLSYFDMNFNIREPIQYYLDKFYERTVKNMIMSKVNSFNDLIEDGNYDGLLKQFEEFVGNANKLKTLLTIEVKSAKEIMELSLEDLILRRVIETGIPTGWRTLDIATGGLQSGNIFLILARVKMGKTLVLLRMANAAFNAGKKVMFISMEMTAKEIGLRLAGLRLGLNLFLLQRNPTSYYTEQLIRQEIERVEDNFKDNFKFVEGQFKTKISEILGLIDTYNPDVVYIDGGYLIKPKTRMYRSKWEEMGEVIEALKTISIRMNIPIAISFQFNREVKRTTKSVEKVAFEKIQLSDAISQIASTGIALLENEDMPNTRKIEIIGGRGGEKGEFVINWDWERMNFDEIEYI